MTLDGKKLGTTPGSFRVPPVKNGKVEVALAQHRSKSFSITIDRNQTVKITAGQATLQAKLGSLQVYADPPEPGAKVFVDGKEVGTAPATVSNLVEGAHEVTIETDQSIGKASVDVTEGQIATKTILLENRLGRLSAGGTVWTDMTSGLMWEVRPSTEKMKYKDAVSYCRNQITGRMNDWRLPTIDELRSLIRGCPATQTSDSCTVTDGCHTYNKTCSGCTARSGPAKSGAFWPIEMQGSVFRYWTTKGGAGSANTYWNVDFSTGALVGNYFLHLSHARCVRVPNLNSNVPKVSENILRQDGKYQFTKCNTVIDSETNLEWYPKKETANYYGAENWATLLKECGGGWRLPTKSEASAFFKSGYWGWRNKESMFQFSSSEVWVSDYIKNPKMKWFVRIGNGSSLRSGFLNKKGAVAVRKARFN